MNEQEAKEAKDRIDLFLTGVAVVIFFVIGFLAGEEWANTSWKAEAVRKGHAQWETIPSKHPGHKPDQKWRWNNWKEKCETHEEMKNPHEPLR